MTAWLTMERSPDGSRAPFAARIDSVGRRLPETRLTTEDLMASSRHRTSIDLERLTGIHERRVSAGDEDSFTLATAAAVDCLAARRCGAYRTRPGRCRMRSCDDSGIAPIPSPTP